MTTPDLEADLRGVIALCRHYIDDDGATGVEAQRLEFIVERAGAHLAAT